MGGGGRKREIASQERMATQQAAFAPKFEELSKELRGTLIPAFTGIAEETRGRERERYETAVSTLEPARQYYKRLASGDPWEIQRAIAPGIKEIEKNKEAVRANILTDMPRGGEQRLALEQANIQAASDVGTLATESYTGAFPELERIAGIDFGVSQVQLANALSAYGAAGATYGASADILGGALQSVTSAAGTFKAIAEQSAARKGAMMGMIGNLAGAGAEMASAGIGKCWIAAALYGFGTVEFLAARRFIFELWEGKTADFARGLYLWLGPNVGRLAEKSGTVRFFLRPIFDMAVAQGFQTSTGRRI